MPQFSTYRPNRTTIPRLLSSVLVVLLLATHAPAQDEPAEEAWIQLFNGEDLDGWNIQIAGYELNDNFGNTFRVEDGLLKVRYDAYDRFDDEYGHIVSERSFSHYKVGVEYRFVGEQVPGAPGWALRNNGIMVHAQSAESMTEAQDYPISIEAQLLGGTGAVERTTANLCTPGTHVVMDGELVTDHCVDSSSETYHGDQWVRAEIIVLGDSLVTHVVEGDTVMSYSKPQIGGGVVNNYDPSVKEDGKPLTKGHIALQSESHPTDFRTVEVLNLVGCTDPEASNYRSYYVKPDTCVY
jgi:hypothetical protein